MLLRDTKEVVESHNLLYTEEELSVKYFRECNRTKCIFISLVHPMFSGKQVRDLKSIHLQCRNRVLFVKLANIFSKVFFLFHKRKAINERILVLSSRRDIQREYCTVKLVLWVVFFCFYYCTVLNGRFRILLQVWNLFHFHTVSSPEGTYRINSKMVAAKVTQRIHSITTFC